MPAINQESPRTASATPRSDRQAPPTAADIFVIWASALAIAALLLLALVNIPVGSENEHILKAFDGDERLGLNLLKRNLVENSLSPYGIYEHGSTYQAITFYALRVLAAIGYQIDEQRIIIISRVLSWLSYAFMLFITYRLMRHLRSSRETSMLAVLLLASLPELVHYAQIIHPDTLQAALVLAAVWAAISRHTAGRALLAAGLCGIAIATKFGGVYLLPFLALPAALRRLSANAPHLPPPSAYLWSLGLAASTAAIAIISFFIAFPHALASFSDFIARMSYIRSTVGTGWMKIDSLNPLLWFPVMYDELSLAGSILVVGGSLGVLWALWHTADPSLPLPQRLVQMAGIEVNRDLLTIIGYLLLTLLAMMIQVRMRTARYLFTLLPCIIIVAFTGIDRISGLLRDRRQLGTARVVLLFTLLTVTAGTVTGQGPLANKQHSGRVLASQWIVKSYGISVPIISDAYTYQPPVMTNYIYFEHEIARGLDRIEHNPDLRLMMLSFGGSGVWAWKKAGTRLQDKQIELHPEYGREDAENFSRFLRSVADGNNPWKLVFENDEILVLENTKARR